MKKLFEYLFPLIGVLQPFFLPILYLVQKAHEALNLVQDKNDTVFLFGYIPLALLLLPLKTMFGVAGTFLGTYLVLYGVFRVIFTLAYWSHARK